MKFYNAKIRINGSLLHEVIRQRLTAPEVLLLNTIHGGSAIVSLDEAGSKAFSPRDHRMERRRLEDKYGQGGQKQKHLGVIRNLFGPVAGQLPESVSMEDVAPLPEEIDDLDAPFPDEPPAKESKETPISDDPKVALRTSIKDLGGSAPPNASVAKLREILGGLQLAQGFAPPDDAGSEIIGGEGEPEPAGVL